MTESGTYDLVVEYRAKKACTLNVYQNSGMIGTAALPASDEELFRFTVRGMELRQGLSLIRLQVAQGDASLLSLSFHKAEIVTETEYSFANGVTPFYTDGDWTVQNGKLSLQSNYGKYMVGSENWGDYVAEADITPTTSSMHTGICVRVSNPATVHNSGEPSGGTNFFQGYFVGIENSRILISKHNFDWKDLVSKPFDAQKGKTYKLRVEVKQNTLQVSLDGTVVLRYTDNDAPFLHGMVGYRAHNSMLSSTGIKVSPLE